MGSARTDVTNYELEHDPLISSTDSSFPSISDTSL